MRYNNLVLWKLFSLFVISSTFLLFSCNSPVDPVSEFETETKLSKVSDLTIDNGMSVSEMNAVIAAASSGQTVYVAAGTYTIDSKLQMKAGVKLVKETSTKPVFDARNTSSGLFEISYNSSEFDGAIFNGIEFRNIRFKITASNFTIKYCVFDYGERISGTTKSYLNDAYIQIINGSENATIRNNTFNRRSGNSGRGIYVKSGVVNTTISYNTFGDGGSTGYFVSAVNNNGNNTAITSNTIRRNASWVNIAETDHGIYAHSFYDLTITNNTISGWPANAAGGAVKARNGENLTISNNTFTTSGVLLYVYSSSTHPFLNNVLVSNNTINVSSAPNDLYHGVGYWRNTTAASEYSIRIEGNNISQGSIKASFGSLNVSDFNADGGGVYNNNITNLYLKSGINQSGNY